MKTFGVHLVCEFSGCNCETLTDKESIDKALHSAAWSANATVLNGYFHEFSPQGISGLLCLAESHISIHTWPESGYAAVDIYTCGDHTVPEKAIEILAKALEAKTVKVAEIKRGQPEAGGVFGYKIQPARVMVPMSEAQAAAGE